MNWLCLCIDTSHAGLDELQNMLYSLDIFEWEVIDEEDFHHFLAHNKKYWDYVDEALLSSLKGKCSVKFYAPDDSSGSILAERVADALRDLPKRCPSTSFGSLCLTIDHVKDSDWENRWRDYYRPMEIGERLIIVPQWLSAEYCRRIPLFLDPGLAFGTGSHATTRMCLKQLDKHIHGGESVLDLGCGSGILSIAALRLGAARATACDIDEKAVSVAYSNAALNHIEKDRYTVYNGDLLTDTVLQEKIAGQYHCVVANIVSDVIIALAPKVKRLLTSDGIFLCSGIIEERSRQVRDALEHAGLSPVEIYHEENWYAFTSYHHPSER